MEMTGEQFVHIANLFLTIINTCGIVCIFLFIFSDPDEDEDEDEEHRKVL